MGGVLTPYNYTTASVSSGNNTINIDITEAKCVMFLNQGGNYHIFSTIENGNITNYASFENPTSPYATLGLRSFNNSSLVFQWNSNTSFMIWLIK